ncbi:hypothetical protein RA24_10880 [Leisingera sp. ANG-M6]|nr:hypothetical protein RA24_10880 [Leisingera sp. ANG-M6]
MAVALSSSRRHATVLQQEGIISAGYSAGDAVAHICPKTRPGATSVPPLLEQLSPGRQICGPAPPAALAPVFSEAPAETSRSTCLSFIIY